MGPITAFRLLRKHFSIVVGFLLLLYPPWLLSILSNMLRANAYSAGPRNPASLSRDCLESVASRLYAWPGLSATGVETTERRSVSGHCRPTPQAGLRSLPSPPCGCTSRYSSSLGDLVTCPHPASVQTHTPCTSEARPGYCITTPDVHSCFRILVSKLFHVPLPRPVVPTCWSLTS